MTEALRSAPLAQRVADIDEFQREMHRLVDWAATYLSNAEEYPLVSLVRPGDIRALLEVAPPTDGVGLTQTIEEIDRVVMPGVTHWNSPQFTAYFANTGSPPGILAEFVTAVLNQNGMIWETSPAATEIEEVSLGWLRSMIGLPEEFFGIVYDTASISTLCAMAAARERSDSSIRTAGLAGKAPMTVYASEEAHSVVDKAAIVLGIGQEQVRKIPTDVSFAMRPDELRLAIERDIAAGLRPFCVVATIGTTSTTSIDPVAEIADICREKGLWLHVDAAYGGTAAILPEMRWAFAGWEHADSICLNPHKWLFVPMDFSAFYTRHPEALKSAFSLVRPYLETDADDSVVNLMDYGPQLGRRFRALKLWLVIRAYGVEGLQAAIRGHIALAAGFEEWVRTNECFELMAPRHFSTVCFRARLADADEPEIQNFNEEVLRRVNSSGDAYLSHTVIRGQYVIRLAIGHLWTDEGHIARIEEILDRAVG